MVCKFANIKENTKKKRYKSERKNFFCGNKYKNHKILKRKEYKNHEILKRKGKKKRMEQKKHLQWWGFNWAIHALFAWNHGVCKFRICSLRAWDASSGYIEKTKEIECSRVELNRTWGTWKAHRLLSWSSPIELVYPKPIYRATWLPKSLKNHFPHFLSLSFFFIISIKHTHNYFQFMPNQTLLNIILLQHILISFLIVLRTIKHL